MAVFLYKTKQGDNPKGKPRVYFTCHCEDFDLYFEKIKEDIFKTHDCAIYYTADMSESIDKTDLDTDLGQMNLFAVPVTRRLLTLPCRAMSTDIAYAKKKGIPILPFVMESDLDELYSRPEYFGERQYLNPFSNDSTEISYEKKLKKHLDSVLISDETARRIRAAFDAYIFLSYRKKDRHYANQLMRLIHKNPACRDIAIWYDEFLTPGENFEATIKRALKDSRLFALLVTPNLLEKPNSKPNYVMAKEYPKAKRARKKIIPAEMEPTDRKTLKKAFRGIPECVDPYDEALFGSELLKAIKKLAITSNDNNPEHNLLIGLAYLDGIDVEVDRDKGIELITSAAEDGLPEAIERLIHIYTDSDDKENADVWSKKLALYYYGNCFTVDGRIGSKQNISRLFSQYSDSYMRDTFMYFLTEADKELNEITVTELFRHILSLGIHEYTLLFDSCKLMVKHKEKIQLMLVSKILEGSLDGTYEPYGPLFWYIPEYELYEYAVYAAQGMNGNARALALVRDVCFIFGQYDRVTDITEKVDGNALFYNAFGNISGARYSLCELFYTGNTNSDKGNDVYPRCFNLTEAKELASTGIGTTKIMTNLFRDELGLFDVTKNNDNLIGLVILPYDGNVESFLSGNIRFVRGIVFLDTDNIFFDYLEFFRKNIRVMYIPENCTEYSPDFLLHASLDLAINVRVDKKGRYGIKKGTHFYVRKRVIIPDSYIDIPKEMFKNCTNLTSVKFPSALAYPRIVSLEEDEEDQYELTDEYAVLHESCFENCTGLTDGIVLPRNTTKIEAFAFCGCVNLTKVTFPNSLITIRHRAFAKCNGLTELIFEKNINIENSAFLYCKGLKKVHFKDGVSLIDNNAFEGCKNLEEVIFTQGIIRIGCCAFYGCGMKRLYFPETAGYVLSKAAKEEFGYIYKLSFDIRAFKNCTELEEAILPNDLDTIPPECFMDCKRLRNVHLPDELVKIGQSAFSCCALTELEIPHTVKSIENYAFANNKHLKKITLYCLDVKVENGIFSDCDNLKEAILPKCLRGIPLGLPDDCRITYLSPADNGENNADREITIPDLIRIPARGCQNKDGLRRITLPDTEIIDEYAFQGCKDLESITAPKLKYVGDWAFAECTALEDISFLTELERIGGGAFERCVNIKEAAFGGNITRIEGWMFAECKNLQRITLPQKLNEIDSGAFKDCEKLELSAVLNEVEIIEDSAFEGCRSITFVGLPAAEQVMDYAFYGCGALESVEFGKELQYLGDGAFEYCSKLKALELANTNITQIGKEAFQYCSGLEAISFPKTLESIGEEAFAGCINLESIINAPTSLTYVEMGTFAMCKKLKKIDLHNVTGLGYCAFGGCTALEEIILSPIVHKVGFGAFSECSSLRNIDLGNELEYIEDNAFNGCSALESISIPLSTKTIGNDAFVGCTMLKHIEISRNFEQDIERIFGEIDRKIIHYIDTSSTKHTHKNN